MIIGKYYGELGVDLWKKEQWDIEFENHQVLVFTAQVFLNLIDHNYFCKIEKSLRDNNQSYRFDFSIERCEFNYF